MLGNAGGKTGMANKPQSFLRYPMVYRKSIPSNERDKNNPKTTLLMNLKTALLAFVE